MLLWSLFEQPGDIVRIHPRFSMYPREEMVPPGCVWLEGDNKLNSTDSRTYGPVPMALLQGRVFMQIWHKFRLIDHTTWEREPQEIEEEDLMWSRLPKTMQELRDPREREEAEERRRAKEAAQKAQEEAQKAAEEVKEAPEGLEPPATEEEPKSEAA